MKKFIVPLLLVLMLTLIPISVLASTFSVSPSSEQTIEVPKDGTTILNFTFPDYEGAVTVGKENLPLDIAPLGLVDISLGEVLTMTFSGDGTNNTYSGKLTFLASGEEQVLVGIKVRLTVYINCTTEVLPTPSSSGGGNGGSAGAGYIIRTNLFGEEIFRYTDNDGQLLGNINATSQDGQLSITMPRETLALEKDGKRLKTLGASINENPPAPPDDVNVIGLPYDFSPAGATFEPPITFTWTYDPDALPEGAVEGELTLAYYLDGEWVELECVVDTENNIVTASVSHFTTFALMIERPKPVEVIAPAPPPAPTPAPPVPVPAPPVITPVPAPTSPPETPTAPAPPPAPPAIPEKPNYTIPIVVSLTGFMVVAFVVWLWYRARGKRNTKYGEDSD